MRRSRPVREDEVPKRPSSPLYSIPSALTPLSGPFRAFDHVLLVRHGITHLEDLHITPLTLPNPLQKLPFIPIHPLPTLNHTLNLLDTHHCQREIMARVKTNNFASAQGGRGGKEVG